MTVTAAVASASDYDRPRANSSAFIQLSHIHYCAPFSSIEQSQSATQFITFSSFFPRANVVNKRPLHKIQTTVLSNRPNQIFVISNDTQCRLVNWSVL